MSRPMMAGLPSKRRCHSAWLSTTTGGAIGRSSSSAITRPRSGGTPSSGEELRRHNLTVEPLGFADASQRRPSVHPCGQRLYGPALTLPIEPVRRRHAEATPGRVVDCDEPLAVWVWQRPQEQLIEDGEDSRVGPIPSARVSRTARVNPASP